MNHRAWVIRVGRIGYLAKGVIFVCVGLLSAAAAIGGGAQASDSRSVLRTIAQQPFGRGLLLALIIGLICHVLWRVLAAVIDAENRGTDAKGLVLRVRSLFVAGIYSGLTIAAVKTLLGTKRHHGGGDHTAQDWTATALATPFGSWLVIAAGLGVIGAGLFQCWRAYSEKFEEKLELDSLGHRMRRTLMHICGFGIAARGVVFGIAGVLLIEAGLLSHPAKARGLSGALGALAAQPFGRWLFAMVAAGLAAYGIYCWVKARYGRFGG